MDASAPLIEKRAQPGLALRFLMLFFISMICFGSYFSYDEIQGFENNWTNSTDPNTLNISEQEYGLLYSVYSIPNTVLVFFGGMVGDRIGLRISSLIFVSFVALGTVMVALGPTILHLRQAWMMMVAGRVLLGIGGESLNVIQTAMTTEWFDGTRFLAMAFGLVLAVSRFGDFLALSVGPLISSAFGGNYRVTLWVGAIFTGISFAFTIIYGLADKWTSKKYPKKPLAEEKINFFAVFRFDARFWLISFITMMYYGGVTPFLANASDFLQVKWDFTPEQAGLVSSVIILASMLLSPILGKVVDTVGYRPYFVVFGGLVILPAHLLLGLSKFTPYLSIVVIGVSFSLVPSALWPSIPLIIEQDNIATAYGMMTAIQNAGLALINFLIGVFLKHFADNNDKLNGYNWLLIALASMDVLAIVLAQVLLYVDNSRGGQLCTKGNAKKEEPEISASVNAAEDSFSGKSN